MFLEVLISCMNQDTVDIIQKSNLNKISTLIINQCNTDREEHIQIDPIHRTINTNTRGLSLSRNMAIENANGDVALLCDDDETFTDQLESIIKKSYVEIPEADIIIFKMKNIPCKLGNKRRKLKRFDLLRVSSVQITFRLKAIKEKIYFDLLLGSGTGNGAGEENKFLLDCYKRGLKIFFDPVEIGVVNQELSAWFKGFDKEYFIKRGSTTRYTYGLLFSIVYSIYFSVTKYNIYKQELSFWESLFFMLKGIKENAISKQKNKI